MSRSRRQPREQRPRNTLRELIAIAKEKDQKNSLQQEGRRDVEGGDCPWCGWITARPVCPGCGAAILDEVHP